MLAFVGNTCHCNWYVSYLLISVILLVIVTDSTGVASTYFAYKVAVSEQFRGHGIGGSLLKIMENDCALARVWCIEGKYYPEGASNEEVSSFYKKHGFEIYKDGYETLVGKTSPTRQNLSGLNIKEDIENILIIIHLTKFPSK